MAILAVAGGSVPALAKDAPKPTLSLDPIVARNLLAPVDDARGELSTYRLDPNHDAAAGQRARLSVDVGDATLFAITGRLTRQPPASGPLNSSDARAIGLRRDSGNVYGAGVARSVGGVDISATYQYSKISAEQPQRDSEAWNDGPGRSHSVRATARIRFKP